MILDCGGRSSLYRKSWRLLIEMIWSMNYSQFNILEGLGRGTLSRWMKSKLKISDSANDVGPIFDLPLSFVVPWYQSSSHSHLHHSRNKFVCQLDDYCMAISHGYLDYWQGGIQALQAESQINSPLQHFDLDGQRTCADFKVAQYGRPVILAL